MASELEIQQAMERYKRNEYASGSSWQNTMDRLRDATVLADDRIALADQRRRDEADREKLIGLVEELVDNEPCRYDHNHFCQSHYCSSPCTHERAKDMLAAIKHITPQRSEGTRELS